MDQDKKEKWTQGKILNLETLYDADKVVNPSSLTCCGDRKIPAFIYPPPTRNNVGWLTANRLPIIKICLWQIF